MYSERSLDRLAAFNDAIVAIAITLLVLPLTDAAAQVGTKSTNELLSEQAGDFIAFLLSFVVIAMFWMRQHETFEHLISYTMGFRTAVIFWILTIVFLPYPTALIANADSHDTAANALYVGTLLATALASIAQGWIIDRNPAMQHPDVPPKDFSLVRAVRSAGLLAIALAISVVFPSIGLWSLLLLALNGRYEALVDKRGQEGPA